MRFRCHLFLCVYVSLDFDGSLFRRFARVCRRTFSTRRTRAQAHGRGASLCCFECSPGDVIFRRVVPEVGCSLSLLLSCFPLTVSPFLFPRHPRCRRPRCRAHNGNQKEQKRRKNTPCRFGVRVAEPRSGTTCNCTRCSACR